MERLPKWPLHFHCIQTGTKLYNDRGGGDKEDHNERQKSQKKQVPPRPPPRPPPRLHTAAVCVSAGSARTIKERRAACPKQSDAGRLEAAPCYAICWLTELTLNSLSRRTADPRPVPPHHGPAPNLIPSLEIPAGPIWNVRLCKARTTTAILHESYCINKGRLHLL